MTTTQRTSPRGGLAAQKEMEPMRAFSFFVLVAVAGCAPSYRYITHSGKTTEGRMCEMQAQRARDYCTRAAGGCDRGEIRGTRCLQCWDEYREAFATCGGSIDKVCVRHCDSAEE